MTDESNGPCGRRAFTTLGNVYDGVSDELAPGQPFCEMHANQILEHAKRVVLSDAETADEVKFTEAEAQRRLRNLHKKRDEFVYFAFNGDRVKIGYTTNPQKRLRSLETMIGHQLSRTAITKGKRSLEQNLHLRFDDSRLMGEWFEATDDIVEYVNQLEPCGVEYQPVS